jgi:hypothetical protein
LSLNIESTSLTTCYQALRINTEFICITRTESKKIIEKVRNGKHVLTVALVKSVLQVLDHMGPTGARSHRRQPRHHGRRGRRHQQQQPRVTLDLDRLHQTGGDPGAGSSRQPLTDAPNPRVRVLERPPSPSHDPLAYRPMKPSDPAASPWGRREPPCTVHGRGPCPYPVA